jgi:Flp pilus assembly protein TadG
MIGIFERRWPLFRRDRHAAVAVITGLSVLPLLGLIAAAVDFGTLTTDQSTLNQALDSATLLAATSASNALGGGASAASATSTAQTLAVARFTAQISNLSSATVSNVTATVTISGANVTAKMNFTANYPTSMMQVFGVNNVPLTGQTTAKLATAPYADIHVLMDISGSMAIGATQTDMNSLQTLSKGYVPAGVLPSNVDVSDGCSFACHWTNSYPDYYSLALSKGITLRIDVLRSALTNLISELVALNQQSLFRLALYTFNSSFSTIYPLSANVSNATSVTSKVAVGVNDCTNGPSPCAETDFDDSVTAVTKIIGTAGDGTSSTSTRKYLIIITDGVVDYYAGTARSIYAADSSICATAKANGVTLWTPYVPLVTPYVPVSNAFYVSYVQPFYNNIWPDLQSCASSPTLAWQASDSADINAALTQMLAIATKTPGHFTQ